MAWMNWRCRCSAAAPWTATWSGTRPWMPNACCTSLRSTRKTPRASTTACVPPEAMPMRYAGASPPTCGKTSTPPGWKCAASPPVAWHGMASATSVIGSSNARTCFGAQPRAPSCAMTRTASFAWAPLSNVLTTPCACWMRAMRCSARSRKKSATYRHAVITSGAPCCARCRRSRPIPSCIRMP